MDCDYTRKSPVLLYTVKAPFGHSCNFPQTIVCLPCCIHTCLHMCHAEPIGFRYQNFSSAGLLIYTFPTQPTTSRDEIAFGVMTKQNNAVLFRVFSEIVNDYIEFRLVST